MRTKIRFKLQGPPFPHWCLTVRLDDVAGSVTVKTWFPEWHSRTSPPPRSWTEPVTHSLIDVAKHALRAAR